MLQHELEDKQYLKGRGPCGKLTVSMGESVTFVLHDSGTTSVPDDVGLYLDRLEQDTFDFWTDWTRLCTFRGHCREQVERSQVVLKLLTYNRPVLLSHHPRFHCLSPLVIRGAGIADIHGLEILPLPYTCSLKTVTAKNPSHICASFTTASFCRYPAKWQKLGKKTYASRFHHKGGE